MTNAKLKQGVSLLYTANPNIIYLRDGEVVAYRRNASPLYQCRYKLADGKWHRVSTRKPSIENAVSVACWLYDEARFRQKLGLAHTAQTFAHIADETLIDLRQQIDMKGTRGAFDRHVSCIEKYFLPYFGDRRLEELTHKDIVEFELWRNRQMNKKPKASTPHNFASAWNRLIKTAIDKGYLSENEKVPRLSTQGAKSNPRPAFTRSEIDNLLEYMKT
jgi:integrase